MSVYAAYAEVLQMFLAYVCTVAYIHAYEWPSVCFLYICGYISVFYLNFREVVYTTLLQLWEICHLDAFGLPMSNFGSEGESAVLTEKVNTVFRHYRVKTRGLPSPIPGPLTSRLGLGGVVLRAGTSACAGKPGRLAGTILVIRHVWESIKDICQ